MSLISFCLLLPEALKLTPMPSLFELSMQTTSLSAIAAKSVNFSSRGVESSHCLATVGSWPFWTSLSFSGSGMVNEADVDTGKMHHQLASVG